MVHLKADLYPVWDLLLLQKFLVGAEVLVLYWGFSSADAVPCHTPMTTRKLQAPLAIASIGQDVSMEQVVSLVFHSAFLPSRVIHIGFNSIVNWLTPRDKTMPSLYLAALP